MQWVRNLALSETPSVLEIRDRLDQGLIILKLRVDQLYVRLILLHQLSVGVERFADVAGKPSHSQ